MDCSLHCPGTITSPALARGTFLRSTKSSPQLIPNALSCPGTPREDLFPAACRPLGQERRNEFAAAVGNLDVTRIETQSFELEKETEMNRSSNCALTNSRVEGTGAGISKPSCESSIIS